MAGAFQSDAFQNDAFQTGGATETTSPTGAITPAGALVELASVHKAGSITPAGVLSRFLSRLLSGAISPAGALRRTAQIFKAGSIAPSGALDVVAVASINPTGEVVPTGALDRLPKVRKAGSIAPSGQLTRAIFRGSASTTTVGSIAPSGTLFVRVIRGGVVVTAPGSGIIPRVLIEGVGDVSSEVVYAQTELTISAGPDANESRMVLRNIGGLTAEYITGKRVTVDLEGEVIWAGYLQRASRQFWFEADRPEHLNRRWVLSLIDLNALFTKRVMYKRSRPKQVSGPVYSAPTYDKAIIEDLLADWIDLSADDLDLTTLVEQVAVVNPSSDVCIPEAQNFYPWNGGFRWGEAMVTIAQVPAAIFGLLPAQPLGSSPFGRLFYCDVDSENAPFELFDLPGDGQRGYREMTLWETGTELVNESFAWGAGKGVDHMVFHHRTASGSIDDHLLWQQGDLLFNIWCQDTIEKVTDSLINGSPTSRRGHKNPVNSVELVTRDDGLRVGQKVRFINNGYGYDEVLPIRKATITFPSPDTRSYKLLLSEALDQWGFQDPPLPFKGMRGSKPTIPDIEIPCSDAVCGITDTFARADTVSGWGTSDSGLVWGGSFANSVNGEMGKITHGGSAFVEGFFYGEDLEVYLEFEVNELSDVNPPSGSLVEERTLLQLVTQLESEDSNEAQNDWFLKSRSGAGTFTRGNLYHYNHDSTSGSTYEDNPEISIAPNVGANIRYSIRLLMQRDHSYTKLWRTDQIEPAYNSSSVEFDDGVHPPSPISVLSGFARKMSFRIAYSAAVIGSGPFSSTPIAGRYIKIDNVLIKSGGVEVTRCSTFRFDTFDRNVAAGWGTSDAGIAWVNSDTARSRTVSAGTQYWARMQHAGSNTGLQESITLPSAIGLPLLDMTVDFWWDDDLDDFGTANKYGSVYFGAHGVFNFGKKHAVGTGWVVGDGTTDSGFQFVTIEPFAWYRIRLQANNAAFKVKLWRVGDTEPDWVSFTPGVSNGDQTAFVLRLEDVNNASDRNVLFFNNLDFDYDGKPCF